MKFSFIFNFQFSIFNYFMNFTVIGIDDNGQQEFSREILGLISLRTVFSGGKRHHGIVRPFLPEGYRWIDITVPLDNVFQQYEGYNEIVVFASGDPLFFGFANTIRKRLPEAGIRLYPYFNSLQILAHRLVLPYHDMHVVSLTGRPWHEFDRALIEGHEKIGLLTDEQHSPDAIARRMLAYGYDNYRMHTGEILGNENERVRTLSPDEAIGQRFVAPNCVILQRTHAHPRPFGIPESEFELLDGRTRMITKMPVRLLTLGMLDLRERHTLWDIGFCTGSVSIEAKLQFPHLQVVAFEQRPEGEHLMKTNAARFGTPGIEVHIGDFTATDLSGITPPDAVFIGGHGGKMEEIICRLNEVIAPGGVIVFNSVSPESKELFIRGAARHGFSVTGEHRLAVDTHNPIDIIQVQKTSAHE